MMKKTNEIGLPIHKKTRHEDCSVLGSSAVTYDLTFGSFCMKRVCATVLAIATMSAISGCSKSTHSSAVKDASTETVTETIGCVLKAGKGPFESMHMKIGQENSMSVEWTDDAYAMENRVIEEFGQLKNDDILGSAYHFASNGDWGGGTLVMHETSEEGILGFVTWTSDTNDLAGIYTCAKVLK